MYLNWYFFAVLNSTKKIKSEDKDFFLIQKQTSLSLNRQPGAHCLVKTLKTDFQWREKEEIPNLKSGLKVRGEEKKKKFRI